MKSGDADFGFALVDVPMERSFAGERFGYASRTIEEPR